MASPLRTVARLLRKGLISNDGSIPNADALTTAQLREYVSAMHLWNPETVEESDHRGRTRADLERFTKRYATEPQLVNRARGLSKSPLGEVRLQALLSEDEGEAPKPPGPSGPKRRPKLSPEPEAEPEGTFLMVDPDQLALLESLRADHRRALEQHRSIRQQETDIRDKIYAAVAAEARTRKLNQQLAEAELRVAQLTDALLGEEGELPDDMMDRIAGCEESVQAMLAEHEELCELREDCPDANVVVALLSEVHSLEEEQEAASRRASKAKADADLLQRVLRFKP